MTKHFSLAEMVSSERAKILGLDNSPGRSELSNLRWTCLGMERVRIILGSNPIKVLSGYRSDRVNSAVGGSPNSQHRFGQAVDFICPAFGSAKDVCVKLAENIELVGIDQLIYEGTWVHASFTSSPRYEVLTMIKGKYHRGII